MMNVPVYVIPKETLRRLEWFLDHFEATDCPHKQPMPKAIDPVPNTAASEPLPPFQTIGDLAAKADDVAALQRTDRL